MTDTALELECRNCGETFWYSGDKKHPETTECPECGSIVTVIEDG